MTATTDRRTDEYRLTRYLAANPLLTVDEAAAELAALDAAVTAAVTPARVYGVRVVNEPEAGP